MYCVVLINAILIGLKRNTNYNVDYDHNTYEVQSHYK